MPVINPLIIQAEYLKHLGQKVYERKRRSAGDWRNSKSAKSRRSRSNRRKAIRRAKTR